MHGTLAWPLEHAARPHGDRIAVIDGDRQLTYRELHQRVRRIGAGLETLGLAPGDFVGVLMGNTLEHLEAWLAVPAYGRVLTTLNTRLAVPELAFMLEDSGTRVLVVDDVHLETGRALLAQCPGLERLVYAGTGTCPDDCTPYTSLTVDEGVAPPELAPDTLAAVSYTGGTTGLPKGVMLSHANVLANTKHLWHTDGFQREDRYLHAGPIFHGAASQMVHPVTWVGATHVMLSRFTPAGFAEAVRRHGVTVSVLVPTMIQLLLDHLERNPSALPTLRLLHYGASPMTAEMLRRAARILGCDFLQGYGMTEAGPGATWLPPQDHRLALAGEHPERLNSVGYAMPGVQVEVRSPTGDRAAEGEIGEVWLRGPNVMMGYLHRAEETAYALEDGWYRSGDAGYCDADGYLFLVDRLKDMIVSGGENVYSIEVERAVAAHEAVAEVAVIGVPDERWGERVHAVVVLAEGASLTEGELIAHCRERIAGYKLPRSVDVRSTPLPKSGAGKILKHALRTALRAMAQGTGAARQ